MGEHEHGHEPPAATTAAAAVDADAAGREAGTLGQHHARDHVPRAVRAGPHANGPQRRRARARPVVATRSRRAGRSRDHLWHRRIAVRRRQGRHPRRRHRDAPVARHPARRRPGPAKSEWHAESGDSPALLRASEKEWLTNSESPMIETRDLTKMYGDLYALNRL